MMQESEIMVGVREYAEDMEVKFVYYDTGAGERMCIRASNDSFKIINLSDKLSIEADGYLDDIDE